jgi:hypothetical protein
MRRALTALAVAITLTGGLAACGDDDKGDKKASAPTKEEWTAEANKICADAQAEVDKLGPAPIGEIAKLPAWANNGVAIRTDQINALSDLEEPTADKAKIDETLAKAKALLEQAKTSLGSGAAPAALVGSLTELQIKQAELQKEIAAHGPASCGPKV